MKKLKTYKKFSKRAKFYMNRATGNEVFFWLAYGIGLQNGLQDLPVKHKRHRPLLSITLDQPHGELRASGFGYQAGYAALHPDMLLFLMTRVCR
ncbi:MAG: hypothetical protein KQH59_06530 [Desulfobulbaceae bacterium]|nr:hypothetical protein [Desulfobulbaceae bacterium]